MHVKAGFSCTVARTGAVTLIQRFGSALNLNLHLTCMDALMPRAQDAQERPMYFFSMVSTSMVRMDRARSFAG